MQHIDLIKIYKDKNCLVVDDMPDVRVSLKGMLSTFGIGSIDTAATSEQAIDLCKNKSYDLVLCDYNLGDGQDGQQVLEELRYRKLLRNASMFIMVTAETSRDKVLGALEYQPDDYLTKPITQTLLQNRLSRFIKRHEDLLPIKQAIDAQEFEYAIELCDQKIKASGKYASSYNKTKGELLLHGGLLDSAETLYLQCLEEKDPIWAQLGLGKTYLNQKRFDDAEGIFQRVIEADSRYVEAHDMLAELYEAEAEYTKAQEAMENASSVSPKSVLRQRRLASIAQRNKDPKISLKARKSALKVGEHSCHYTPQDYFDVVHELLNTEEDSENDKHKKIKDAEMYLKRAEKKHPGDKAIKLQSTAAKVKLCQSKGKEEQALNYLEQAKELYSSGIHDPYASLELSMAMDSCGDSEGATELRLNIANTTPNDSDMASRIDALSDEPISKQGREIAERLTKQGIGYFDKRDFDQAINVFLRANKLFPKHNGLRLNIVQVTLEKIKDSGSDKYTQALINEHLGGVANLPEQHPQYPRYQHLLKEAEKLKD